MTIAIVRAGSPVEWGKPQGASPGPLSWRPVVPHPDRPAAFADAIALVSCTNGHECILSSKVHTVGPDGTVSPSDVCPVPGCGFHDYIKLEGWPP